jgi:hypothetical protein
MSILLLSAVLSTACAISTPSLNDEDIQHAISMIAEELLSRHRGNNCWEPEYGSDGWLTKFEGGATALTTLALLSSGESINCKPIETSLSFLESIEFPSTYVLATRTSIWSMMPEKYKKNIKRDSKKLISSMSLHSGSWGNYETPPSSRSYSSPLNREFGMIALREATRSGQRVPKECWLALANATLLTQHKNGGWSYQQGANSGKTTSNMTVAALNCLLGVDEMHGRNLNKKDAAWLHNSIEQAIAWLNKYAKTTKNVGGTTLMSYLYGLERAAMSCGLAEIHNRDWFRDGAIAIVSTHCGVRKAKGSTVNLSFALLFLSRGRIPIALCELAQDKGIVDPLRTSEIITQRVSNHTERALAWQLVTSKEKVTTWLSSPILFVQDIHAIPEDKSKLTLYLDQGGLLVMLGSKKNAKQFTSIANELLPKCTSTKVGPTHWSCSIMYKIKSINITTWNDGIRDRIILVDGSAKKLVSSEKSKLSQLLVNICCGAAELENWKPRLFKSIPAKSKKTIWVAEHSGSWNAEMAGLLRWKLKSAQIHQIKKKQLVLVSGIHANEATDKLANEVIRLATAGSNILVETIGGQGGFASTLQAKVEKNANISFSIAETFNHLTSKRGWSIQNRIEIKPILVTTLNKGKVYIVDCDLRNALLPQTSWGIHGHTTESAVEIIDTLLEE